MKLEADFLADVKRVIYGKFLTSSEANKLAKQLDSTEELFAWLLLRHGLGKDERELSQYIKERAHQTIIKAETKRQQTGFIAEQQLSLHELADNLTTLLKQSDAAIEINEKASLALADFLLKNKVKNG